MNRTESLPEAAVFEDVRKSFKVYTDKSNTLRDKLFFWGRNKHSYNEVLKGISFSIPKGQCVGLIGKNGCGKSTTLKLLTRILRPNSGTVRIKGRVSSLIELGAGFHPDMTGRENIYINASIFGLKRREIDERLNDIIRFSELEEFIDNPVRTYSSGMYMRLAFAVAINVRADILLIDEILAVGDISFQKKCFAKLREIKERGTTIVIVSHAMQQLLEICDRMIWIENGFIREDGEPEPVSRHYLDSMEEERRARLSSEHPEEENPDDQFSLRSLSSYIHPEAKREGSFHVHYTSVKVLNAQGDSCYLFDCGDKLVLKCRYETQLEHPLVNFNMDIVKDNWQYQYGSCYARPGAELACLEKTGEICFTIDSLQLLPGNYLLSIGINGADGELYDHVRFIKEITVREYPHNEFGPCTFPHSWEIH